MPDSSEVFPIQGGYSINSDYKVNMNPAPLVHLTIELPPQYVAEMVAVMLHKE